MAKSDATRTAVTPEQTPAALAAFASAAVQVALDTRSGDEDDYAWQDFGIPVAGVSDGPVPGTLVIETTTGRRYALAFAATELAPGPAADPADLPGPTFCKLHDRWETTADDADHTPAPEPDALATGDEVEPKATYDDIEPYSGRPIADVLQDDDEPTRLVVTLEGGLVQDVSTFGLPVDVLVLDFDAKEATADEPTETVGEDRAYASLWRPREFLDGFQEGKSRDDVVHIMARQLGITRKRPE